MSNLEATSFHLPPCQYDTLKNQPLKFLLKYMINVTSSIWCNIFLDILYCFSCWNKMLDIFKLSIFHKISMEVGTTTDERRKNHDHRAWLHGEKPDYSLWIQWLYWNIEWVLREWIIVRVSGEGEWAIVRVSYSEGECPPGIMTPWPGGSWP